MPSGLRAKLDMIGAASKPVAKPARGGLVRYTESFAAPEGIYLRDELAYSRLGCEAMPDISRCLFLDTETTGLSGGAGTVAFLVGVGYLQGDEFIVKQFMMRDYSDEPEMLIEISKLLNAFDNVVTFNGRRFDMPLLSQRFTMSRMSALWRELADIDLLYPARRLWRLRLESCRLSNLESMVLGVERDVDIPGSEVPSRYFEYLRTGDMGLLTEVIEHNRQDVFTLAVLLSELLRIYAAPECESDARDLLSLGKTLEMRGETENAKRLYALSAESERFGKSPSINARWRLFVLSRRSKDYETAVSALMDMIAAGELGILPHIEMAKLMEHKLCDLAEATHHTRLAMAMAKPWEKPDINKRLERLRRKQQRKNLEDV